MDMNSACDRRTWLAATGTALGAALTTAWADPPANTSPAPRSNPARPADEPFGYCFNTSTIRQQALPLPRILPLVAQAGYTAIEPWIREIDAFTQQGGRIEDLAQQARDLGLTIASAIGFAEWIVDNDEQRARGLEEARRCMDLVARLGGRFLAAPPAGATREPGLNLQRAGERYRVLCELGQRMGVAPQLEVWGHSQNLSRLSESLYVAVESGHPQACLLLDVYHLYKGGSSFESLQLCNGTQMHCFHINDYPAEPPRAQATDADRVYPGDGVAPLNAIFRTLAATGYRGYLSLELFNRQYWMQDPAAVVRTGLEKTRAAVRRAFAA